MWPVGMMSGRKEHVVSIHRHIVGAIVIAVGYGVTAADRVVMGEAQAATAAQATDAPAYSRVPTGGPGRTG